MPVYERLFDIEYPLSKLDTLIVSFSCLSHWHTLNSQATDFDLGAMENWVSLYTLFIEK
jgi:aminopeptidase N